MLQYIWNFMYYRIWLRNFWYRPSKLIEDCIKIGHRLGTYNPQGFNYEDDEIKFYYRHDWYTVDIKIIDKENNTSFYTDIRNSTEGVYHKKWVEHIRFLRKDINRICVEEVEPGRYRVRRIKSKEIYYKGKE